MPFVVFFTSILYVCLEMFLCLPLLPKRIFPVLRQVMFISSFSKTLNMPSNIFPADAYPLDNNDTNDGRITKYAAEALMARAYLYHTGYQLAEMEHPSCTKAEAVAAINDVVQKWKNMNWRKTMPTSGCLLVLLMLRMATLMPGIRHTPASE